MGFALLFMALVPLAFLPDYLSSADDENPDNETGFENDQPDNGDNGQLLDDSAAEPPADTVLPADVLTPVAGDEADVPAPPDPNWTDPANALEPTIEDDVASDTQVANPDSVLLPVDQIDSDPDVILLDPNDNGGVGYTELSGFEPGADTLQIAVTPDNAGNLPKVSVSVSDDGDDGLVYLDQDLIAILRGVPWADVEDITILPRAPAR